MLVARPAELASDDALVDATALLVPPDRWEAYAEASGVDLRRTPSALVAGFDFGVLYMAEVPGGTARVEERFVERLLTEPEAKSPHPQVRRVTGIVGRTPQTFVRLDPDVVAVSVGDPTPARVVALYALGRLQAPRALEGAALHVLPRDVESAPVRFYAPGPFADEWARAGRGILRDALAVAISARPVRPGVTEAQLVAVGEWSDDAPARLLEAWDDLAGSRLGRLLGLHEPAAAPVLGGTSDALRLTVELNLRPMANGLHAAVAADVWQMMDLRRDSLGQPDGGAPPPEAPPPRSGD